MGQRANAKRRLLRAGSFTLARSREAWSVQRLTPTRPALTRTATWTRWTQSLLPVPTLGRYAEARRLLFATAADARPCGTTCAWGHLIADPSGTIYMVGA